MDLLFAKGNNSGAPISLGTVNAAVTGEGWYNNIIGRVFIDTSAETDDGDNCLSKCVNIKSSFRPKRFSVKW